MQVLWFSFKRATSRIPSLSALFISRLLGRDQANLSPVASWNISRNIYNPLRCRPLLARYRAKISVVPYKLASCMKNLPSRFLARFLPKLPPTASHLAIPCEINEIAPHKNASWQIQPRLEAHYYPNYAVGERPAREHLLITPRAS